MDKQQAAIVQRKFIKILSKIYNDEIPMIESEFLKMPKYKNIKYSEYLKNFSESPLVFNNGVDAVDNFLRHSKEKHFCIRNFTKAIWFDESTTFKLRTIQYRLDFDIDGNITSLLFVLKEKP